MLAVTLDIDWAPEIVILDALQIFEKYNVKCTLFCTHDSKVIRSCKKELFEIAIHPNFNSNLYENSGELPKKKINDLLSIYPTAKGLRSHSLTSSSSLSNLFSEIGFKYESNTIIPYSQNIEITKLWNGLYSIPINWEDDIHMYYNNDFKNLKININNKNLNILNFHPIHIYLNSDKLDIYNIAKYEYNNPEKLNKFINTTNLGTRDLLIKTLDEIQSLSLKNYKLHDLVKKIKL